MGKVKEAALALSAAGVFASSTGPSGHAKLSPSASSRWIPCPGSVHAEAVVLDTGSQAADEGTAGHALFEKCLRLGRKARFFIGDSIKSIKVTAEMAGWVQEALDWVDTYLKAHPHARVFSEREVDIGLAFGLPVTEDGKTILWGTSDIIIEDVTELVVADLKLGYHPVEVLGNTQLTLYSIGAEHELAAMSYRQVRHVILQPRNGGISEEVLSVEELHERRSGLFPAIKAALDPMAPRVPGEKQCRWCPAAPACVTLKERALAVAKREFMQVDTLSPAQLAEVLEQEELVLNFLRAVRNHALRLRQTGIDIPGWKVVLGDKHRVWKDEKKATKALSKFLGDPDEYAPRKLLTPAQAEKKIGGKEGKAVVESLAEKPEGEPTLVPSSDKREALPAEFEVIT